MTPEQRDFMVLVVFVLGLAIAGGAVIALIVFHYYDRFGRWPW